MISDHTAAVYRALRLCIQYGFPPTLRELAEACRMTPQGVRWHLQVMERAGLIDRVKGSPRAIRLRKATLQGAKRLGIVNPRHKPQGVSAAR